MEGAVQTVTDMKVREMLYAAQQLLAATVTKGQEVKERKTIKTESSWSPY